MKYATPSYRLSPGTAAVPVLGGRGKGASYAEASTAERKRKGGTSEATDACLPARQALAAWQAGSKGEGGRGRLPL